MINQDTLRTLDSADAIEGLITDNKDFIDSLSKLEDLKQEIKLHLSAKNRGFRVSEEEEETTDRPTRHEKPQILKQN